jgi:O-antigen ligase
MLLRSVGAGLVAIDPADIPDWDWSMVSRWAHALYLWTALLAILAFGHRLLDRPRPWLSRANEAVYPWYILHQSLIVPLAFMTIPLGLAGWLEAGVVLAGTVLGCFLIHEWLIRRTPLLRPLFGLPRAAVNR